MSETRDPTSTVKKMLKMHNTMETLRAENDRLREALTAARDFIENSAFNVPTKDRFDAVLKTIDVGLAKEAGQ